MIQYISCFSSSTALIGFPCCSTFATAFNSSFKKTGAVNINASGSRNGKSTSLTTDAVSKSEIEGAVNTNRRSANKTSATVSNEVKTEFNATKTKAERGGNATANAATTTSTAVGSEVSKRKSNTNASANAEVSSRTNVSANREAKSTNVNASNKTDAGVKVAAKSKN